MGIGIIAIPTGIIAAGFSRVINKENQKDTSEEEKDPKKYCPYYGHKTEGN